MTGGLLLVLASGKPPSTTPPSLPAAEEVMARSGGENFPVALRILSRDHRLQLTAIYGFARLVDELGDAYRGDRLTALDWLDRELDRAYEGEALHPLTKRLQRALATHPLPREPFRRLIEANRLDQRVANYETFEQLLSYCELSANPVGELVLHVFGLATPERIALSDRICSALQLAEHWQDVVEDSERGRVYLPAEDLHRFGVAAAELSSADAALRSRMRELMAFEVARARGMLAEGAPLVAMTPGRPKLALAAFVAGGGAALDAIERAGFDVLDGPPKASRLRRLMTLAGVLAERRR
jgi:squalene synthase HpnC